MGKRKQLATVTIEQEWPQLLERRLESGMEVIAKLITDEKHYRLEVRSPDIAYVWKADFCACIMNKESGLRWDFANKLEREFLKLSIKDLLFSHADTVLIDEERYPLLDKNEAIQSTFSNEIEDFRLSLGSP